MARMPKCDCLNWCGDDSRVPNGKAKPCERWLKEQAAAEERWDMEEDAARWRWLTTDCDGNAQDDFLRWLAGTVASKADIDAKIDSAMKVPNLNSPTPPVA